MKDRTLIALLLLCMAVSLLGYTMFHGEEGQPVSNVPRPVQTDGVNIPRTGAFPFMPVIDPGHGGFDGGAVSLTGAYESHINLDIALKTDLVLRFLGLPTVMTRETDRALYDTTSNCVLAMKSSDLRNRTAMVNNVPNGVLLSIHQNIFSQAQYRGAQVFHNGDAQNRAFAEFIQERLRVSLDPENRREAKKADIYILRHVTHPAILIECGFLSNPGEEALLRDPAYQRKLALTISGGLVQWAIDS